MYLNVEGFHRLLMINGLIHFPFSRLEELAYHVEVIHTPLPLVHGCGELPHDITVFNRRWRWNYACSIRSWWKGPHSISELEVDLSTFLETSLEASMLHGLKMESSRLHQPNVELSIIHCFMEMELPIFQ